MTVCQFFLQGRCRFGLNCKFEHSYNTDDQNVRNAASTQQLGNVIRQIVEEVVAAEKGGQWPLSCFAPVKEGINMAGFEDISPEEVRWKMYQANATGTLNQCMNEIKELYKKAKQQRTILKTPTIDRVNLIVNVLKGKKDPPNSSNPFGSTNKFGNNEYKLDSSSNNVFGGSTAFASNPTNIFGGTTPSTGSHGSIFGNSSQTSVNQGNILGGSSTSFPTQNIFSNSPQSSNFSKNIFASAQPSNQNLFTNSSAVTNNIFTSTPVQNQNIFSSGQPGMQGNNQNSNLNAFSSSGTNNIFSNQGSSQPVFGSPNAAFQTSINQSKTQSNIFGNSQNQNVFKNQNSFGNTNDVFSSQQKSSEAIFGNQQNLGNLSANTQAANPQAANPQAMDTSVFSKVEDLTEEELQSFAAPTFTFGKIPLKPPPQEYCK